MNKEYRALIPCAGFGTRVKMLPHQAKELLPDEDGKVTIEWSLKLCEKHHIEPVIITRPEKEEFNQYLRNRGIKYVFPEGKSVGESLLSAEDLWLDYNVVILPDTRFEYPKTLFQDMLHSMELGNECVFACFKVEDYQNWGIVCKNRFYEKPIRDFYPEDNAWAWGVFGFTKEYGFTLLRNYYKHSILTLENPGYFYIHNFRDISR